MSRPSGENAGTENLSIGNSGIAPFEFTLDLLWIIQNVINHQKQKRYPIMSHPESTSQNYLQQVFERLALNLADAFDEFGVADSVYWDTAKHVHRAFELIEAKLLPKTQLNKEANLHPAVAELIRRINQLCEE